jgi:hypothetical protein
LSDSLSTSSVFRKNVLVELMMLDFLKSQGIPTMPYFEHILTVSSNADDFKAEALSFFVKHSIMRMDLHRIFDVYPANEMTNEEIIFRTFENSKANNFLKVLDYFRLHFNVRFKQGAFPLPMYHKFADQCLSLHPYYPYINYIKKALAEGTYFFDANNHLLFLLKLVNFI